MNTIYKQALLFFLIFNCDCKPNALQYQNQMQSGHSNITYYFSAPENKKSYPIIVCFQGSQCESVYSLFTTIKKYADSVGYGLVMVEKPGIQGPEQIDHAFYLRENNVIKRTYDASLIINSFEATLEGFNKKLIVMGGSEGSVVSLLMAHKYQERTKAVVLFATGNLSKKFEDVVAHNITLQNAKQLRVPYILLHWLVDLYCTYHIKRIKMNPYSTEHAFGGPYSNLWWTTILNINCLQYLSTLNCPIYVANGSEDDPHDDNAKVCDQLKITHHMNIVNKNYPGLDHSFTCKNKVSHKELVIKEAFDWLKLQKIL